MKFCLKIIPFIVAVFIVFGCVRAVPRTTVKTAETMTSAAIAGMDYADDLDRASLELAIARSLHYYENLGRNRVFRVEGRSVNARRMTETLIAFRELLRKSENAAVLNRNIAAQFNVYRISGNDQSSNALFTGYYIPLLEGSLRRTERYRYPLYKVPPDLIRDGKKVSRMQNGKRVPYYSRREIDVEGILKGKNLELVWVADPVELFSLHMQGSGKIKLANGDILTVGYAQTNGRPFRSISRFMLENGRIGHGEASYRHPFLKGKSDQEIYDILSHNERYTFFRLLDGEPRGALGEPVTPGRSIATDPDFFPEGALAFIRLSRPVFDKDGNVKERVKFSRFVLGQDRGTDIEGPGRVDLFCGFGEEAELTAGNLKEKGEMYLLIKKQ